MLSEAKHLLHDQPHSQFVLEILRRKKRASRRVREAAARRAE